MSIPVLRRSWGAVTALLATAILVQAALAGAILSGVAWARPAHALTAALLIAGAGGAGLVGLATLRRIPHGSRLGLTLLALAAATLLQAAVGEVVRHGAPLMWIHVPLGVALVGLAMRAAAGARQLGAA